MSQSDPFLVTLRPVPISVAVPSRRPLASCACRSAGRQSPLPVRRSRAGPVVRQPGRLEPSSQGTRRLARSSAGWQPPSTSNSHARSSRGVVHRAAGTELRPSLAVASVVAGSSSRGQSQGQFRVAFRPFGRPAPVLSVVQGSCSTNNTIWYNSSMIYIHLTHRGATFEFFYYFAL